MKMSETKVFAMQGPVPIHRRLVQVYNRLVAEGFSVKTRRSDPDNDSGDENGWLHPMQSGDRTIFVEFPTDNYMLSVSDNWPDNDEPQWIIPTDYYDESTRYNNRNVYMLATMDEFIARVYEIAKLHK